MQELTKQTTDCIKEGHIKQAGDNLALVIPSRKDLRNLSRDILLESLNKGESSDLALKKSAELEQSYMKRNGFCELVLKGPVVDRVANGDVNKSWIEKFSQADDLTQVSMLKEYISKHEQLGACNTSPDSWNADLTVSSRTKGQTTTTKVGVSCGSQALDLLIHGDPSTGDYGFYSVTVR